MDFTVDEKRIIAGALEAGYDDVPEKINNTTQAALMGCKFEGEIADSVIGLVTTYETVLNIERKIFESVEDNKEAKGALNEILTRIEQVGKCQKIIGLFEDDEQPETDDSDGVLADKAQD